MKSQSIYKLRYKEILTEAKTMWPGLSEATALACYMEVQTSIINATITSVEKERAVDALRNKAWAGELYQIFEDRKN